MRYDRVGDIRPGGVLDSKVQVSGDCECRGGGCESGWRFRKKSRKLIKIVDVATVWKLLCICVTKTVRSERMTMCPHCVS